jgi:hypothetical protein
VGAAALSVAVVVSVAAPAVAFASDHGQPSPPKPPVSTPTTPAPPTPNSQCSELAKNLVAQLPGISSDLMAKPPRIDDATNLITNALNGVTALQKAGCLPNVPSNGASTPSSTCVANVAKVLADLFGLVSDLSGIPDVAGAATAARGVVSDVTALVDSKCLSSGKLPTPPAPKPITPAPTKPPTPGVGGKVPTPTPTPKLAGAPLPLASVPVPTPTPPKVDVPKPSVPVPTPSAPKVPVPVLTPSKPGLPSLPDNPSLPGLPTLPSLPGASNFPTAPDAPSHSPSPKGK